MSVVQIRHDISEEHITYITASKNPGGEQVTGSSTYSLILRIKALHVGEPQTYTALQSRRLHCSSMQSLAMYQHYQQGVMSSIFIMSA
jgi:hypothetical protein